MSAMSNPLSFQAVAPIAGSGARSLSALPARAQTPVAPAAKPVPLYVNPSYQFDPTVGLVVIEFHDNAGTLTNSIPTQRQLEAYRTHQETPPGEGTPSIPQAANGKTTAG
jgi:hypothetical protein